MDNSDRSHSKLRRFAYGCLVTTLAAFLITLAFLPRQKNQYVASILLACEGTELPSKAIWNQLIDIPTVLEVADAARLFHPAVPQDRRIAYLKDHFQLRTHQGDGNEAVAELSVTHPHADRAVEFLERLAERVIDSHHAADSQQSDHVSRQAQASLSSEDHETYYATLTKTETSMAKPKVRAASLVQSIDGPTQSSELQQLLAEAQQKLAVAQIRYRGLVDAAGGESELSQHFAYEVDRLTGLVASLAARIGASRFDDDESKGTGAPAQTPIRMATFPSMAFVASESSESSDSAGFDAAGNSQPPRRDAKPLTIRILQPAEVVQIVPGGVDHRALAASVPYLLVPGLIVGFLVAREGKSDLIVDRESAEKVLGEPVVGSVFPTREPPKKTRASGLQLLGQGIMRLSELTLCGFLIFLVFCVTTDKTFSDQFLQNPLRAYTASLDRYVFDRIDPSFSGDDISSPSTNHASPS